MIADVEAFVPPGPVGAASQRKPVLIPIGQEEDEDARARRYLFVLPVLFYEFLAIALARSLLPGMLVDEFGGYTYHIIGAIETVKGCLAFVACPMFGRLSDVIGRKRCLLMTVLGTTLPICVLSVTNSLWTFLALQALSGIFAATFPLTFAYVADFVPRDKRATAYGMALATFGLSFSIGPVIGGYLARAYGGRAVFICSTLLVAVDAAYICLVLPESMMTKASASYGSSNGTGTTPSSTPSSSSSSKKGMSVRIPAILRRGTPGYETGRSSSTDDTDYLPFQWNPLASLQAFQGNPLLHRITVIVFLYYTAVWAVVSTLMIYVTRKFQFSAVTVGKLLSAHGVTTMFAEGILVRYLVPWFGEKLTMQLGLLGFAVQCILIGLADAPWMVFASMGGSLLSNLVYPSISSLVSKNVGASAQGEVLGTINGVRALTEGWGPLIFGILMARFEGSIMSGAPYLIAAGLSIIALVYSFGIPDSNDSGKGAFGIDTHGHDAQELEPLLETVSDCSGSRDNSNCSSCYSERSDAAASTGTVKRAKYDATLAS